MDKYRFTSEKVNFMGEDGYFVRQHRNGKVAVEQFIAASEYADFCKLIGLTPDLQE